MKHYHLKREEQAGIGYTDLFIVTQADFTEAVDNTNQSITLASLAVGDVVMNNVLLEVRTNANVVAAVTGAVGVTGSTAALLAAANLLAAGDEYYISGASIAPYVAIAAVDLLFTGDPGTTDNLAEMTAGEFWIWASISRKADRNVQA